ncbi:glutamine synthetase/guanido kinase [Gigaspora margarita]|uniref:Glutamine synthetase/guanido kinase n=1 Tax=Gigaspora margarita TaxID=4874 RepID=A0A8H4EK33_GIGMA|nr:glutamine synthetase/guanido kinase [Gigaspora margarita]
MGVKFVRVGYIECSSQYRFHIVPIDRFQNYIVNHGVTIMRALTALPYYADIVPKDVGVTATGELLMKPDLSTLIHLPYNPKHANVQAFFENKLTLNLLNLERLIIYLIFWLTLFVLDLVLKLLLIMPINHFFGRNRIGIHLT